MLETKIFEIRDRATFFVAYATFAGANNNVEGYLLSRDGFDVYHPRGNVIFCRSHGKANYDPYDWGDRTYKTAHLYISNNWHTLNSGDVIDVEFILGETAAPKLSERITAKI